MAATSVCRQCLRASRLLSRAGPVHQFRHPSIIPARHRISHARVSIRHQSTASAFALAESTQFLAPSDLYHSYTRSPIRAIRERAAYIRANAFCPHPSHALTRVPSSQREADAQLHNSTATLPPTRPAHECPDCGIPIYCSEAHYEDDYPTHIQHCDTLRQVNEDDHDLHSGRHFPEFENPPSQTDEIMPNMLNWDTLLYTREHHACNDDRQMRQATKLLTYPLTIASVIHELSPYSLRDRLTPEGLKSFTALRFTLHRPRDGSGLHIRQSKVKPPPVRVFVVGARAESSLPRSVWLQLGYLFPQCQFNVIFIGPESMVGREAEYPLPNRTPSNPFGGVVEDRLGSQMKINTFVEYFQTMHQTQYFAPYDPYFDLFVLFHPGLGYPGSSPDWELAVRQMLGTKCPVVCTGFTEWDMQRDREWVEKTVGGEVDLLMSPGENTFRSMRWDLNDDDPQGDISCGNWGVWAFRGKRYEAIEKEGVIAL